MSVPPYSDYKDTGIPLLGKAPAHWKVTALKRLVDSARPITYGIVQAGPHAPDGIPYIRPADMTAERGVPDPSELLRTTDEIAAAYRRSVVRDGDLICSIGPSFGKVMVVPPELDGANLTQGTARVAIGSGADLRFIFWVLRSINSVAQWESGIGGATFRALNLEPLANTACFEPPIDEQAAIAAFLDRETAKIDALVEEQRRLIALLKEKRQAVISHAVTKGLNPDAPMKDSGIQWLGEVPVHWEVRPLGGLLVEPPCYGVLVPDSDPEGIPMLRITDMDQGRADRDELNKISPALSDQFRRTIMAAGDLALSVVGTIGECLIIDEALEGVNLSRAVARLRAMQNCDVHYLRWIFRSPCFAHFVDLTCVGTAQRVLNMGDLSSARFAVPPVDEQAEIDKYLRRAVGGLEELTRTAERAMSLFGERRAALISAAVTGKIDVRGLVAPAAEMEAA